MAKANMSLTRNPMPNQDPLVRAHNFSEVALGYSEETAIDEANRCLNCKHMPCVDGCPVKIHIPEFIAKIKEVIDREYEEGRTTAMGDDELDNIMREIDFDEYERLCHIHVKKRK